MNGVLIVTHGDLAKGFLSAAEMIIGPKENVCFLSLNPEDSVDSLPEKIEQKINEFNDINGVLILADLFGASPFNCAARVAHKYNQMPINVVAGVNLGMLLEVLLNCESKTIEELSEIAVNAGNQAIKSLANSLEME